MNSTLLGTLPENGLHVGCDLQSVSDVAESIAAFGDRYLERVFTAAERAACAGDAERLAARYAAKEAVYKALRVPARIAVPWTTIEVHTDSVGAPTVTLTGPAADFALANDIVRIELSLSHEGGFALAFAVAITDGWHYGRDAS